MLKKTIKYNQPKRKDPQTEIQRKRKRKRQINKNDKNQKRIKSASSIKKKISSSKTKNFFCFLFLQISMKPFPNRPKIGFDSDSLQASPLVSHKLPFQNQRMNRNDARLGNFLLMANKEGSFCCKALVEHSAPLRFFNKIPELFVVPHTILPVQ